MRTINLELLNYWIATNGPLAKEDLSSQSRIGFHKVTRILRGERMPSELEQTAICKATGLNKSELFPLVEKVEKSA